MHTRLDATALLRIAREHGDRSRYAIWRRTGLSRTTLTRLISGQTAPSMQTLNRLSATYNVPVSALLTSDVRSDAA